MIFSVFRRMRYIYGSPPLDNFIFKLCYRWTTLLLVAFSFIVTCRLLFGYSFACISADDRFSKSYLYMKCYDSTVYTLPSTLVPDEKAGTTSSDDYKRYQSYYSWVNLLFLVHAFNFYLPHLLWKSYEKGYMNRLTARVQKVSDKEEKRGLELCYLAKYVLVTQGKHKLYMAMYIFFEICNYAISLAQTLWLVHFFDVTGVPDFLPYVLGTWSDFKKFYFPSEGFCEFRRFGASGVIMRYTAMCQLPINPLYMKMFLFLYVWYIFLTVLCGLVLIFRIALLVTRFRLFVAKISSPLSERSVLMSVCHKLSYSDWFFLSSLQKAMADVDFAQMVDKIAVASQGKDPQQKEEDMKFSLCEDATKDFDSSNVTSPL